MPKKIPIETNECSYVCVNGTYILSGGNPSPGFYCPDEAGVCGVEGEEIRAAAIILASVATRSLALNQGQYLYHVASKKLFFSGGKSAKGRFFPNELTVKELAKIDEKAATLVKSLQKNKSIASFSIILKAQKIA